MFKCASSKTCYIKNRSTISFSKNQILTNFVEFWTTLSHGIFREEQDDNNSSLQITKFCYKCVMERRNIVFRKIELCRNGTSFVAIYQNMIKLCLNITHDSENNMLTYYDSFEQALLYICRIFVLPSWSGRVQFYISFYEEMNFAPRGLVMKSLTLTAIK